MLFSGDVGRQMITDQILTVEEAKQEKMGSWLNTGITVALSHNFYEYKILSSPRFNQ